MEEEKHCLTPHKTVNKGLIYAMAAVDAGQKIKKMFYQMIKHSRIAN